MDENERHLESKEDQSDDSEACPLCGEALGDRPSGPLYKHTVCDACRTAFARRRLWAFVIDVVFFSSIVFLAAIFYWLLGDPMAKSIVVVAANISWLLFFAKDGFDGQSPGKWMQDLQVIDTRSGKPIELGPSFVRNIPVAIVPLAFWIAAELRAGPRMGDTLANTQVIWKRYRDQTPFLQTDVT